MNANEKYEKILSWINRNEWKSQRLLAWQTGMSLGTVNAALREMEKKKMLEKQKKGYSITALGEDILSHARQERSKEKVRLPGSGNIDTAVLLAAGGNTNFDRPEGMLQVADTLVIDRILNILKENGVQEIYLVVGEAFAIYQKYLKNRVIKFIINDRAKWSGTMYSLMLAKDVLQRDFLLVECNQIFESAAITELLQSDADNAIMMTVPSGSGDEAFVELGENDSIFRIAKDIRQLNRIDGEAVGLCKITIGLYKRMLIYYQENTNPMLNYEYVLEALGRTYGIRGVMVNDLAWTVLENKDQLTFARNILYPKILQREIHTKEKRAKMVAADCLQVNPERITNIRTGGGMTNTNYIIEVDQERFMLRLPGACTGQMIQRANEKKNTDIAEKLGLNPKSIYFDEVSGIKITTYIPGAATLNARTARLENSVKKTTELMRCLHEYTGSLQGAFSVEKEYRKYKKMISAHNISCYEGFEEMDQYFFRIIEQLSRLGIDSRPCHNDLVPENFVRDRTGRMYLIDWEYAGMNDPMWDVASHLLECDFQKEEEELFLSYYFQWKTPPDAEQKIWIYKICQDILWSAWTVIKENEGENFGTYGVDRLHRAFRLKEGYEERYGTGKK